MIYTALTSVVVCGSIFVALLALSAYVNKKASRISVSQNEEREFKTSNWYWSGLIGFFLFLFSGISISSYFSNIGFSWEVLLVPVLMLFLIGSPLAYAGFAAKVIIKDGCVCYHNGINSYNFSLKNIIKCELSSQFLIEVIHAQNPHKSIIISPMFKDTSRLVAILKRN